MGADADVYLLLLDRAGTAGCLGSVPAGSCPMAVVKRSIDDRCSGCNRKQIGYLQATSSLARLGN